MIESFLEMDEAFEMDEWVENVTGTNWMSKEIKCKELTSRLWILDYFYQF